VVAGLLLLLKVTHIQVTNTMGEREERGEREIGGGTVSVKDPFMNRTVRALFPTPPEPTITIRYSVIATNGLRHLFVFVNNLIPLFVSLQLLQLL